MGHMLVMFWLLGQQGGFHMVSIMHDPPEGFGHRPQGYPQQCLKQESLDGQQLSPPLPQQQWRQQQPCQPLYGQPAPGYPVGYPQQLHGYVQPAVYPQQQQVSDRSTFSPVMLHYSEAAFACMSNQ